MGKGKGIELSSLLLVHFKHSVGFAFTWGFVRPILIDFMTGKLKIFKAVSKAWYCDSGGRRA